MLLILKRQTMTLAGAYTEYRHMGGRSLALATPRFAGSPCAERGGDMSETDAPSGGNGEALAASGWRWLSRRWWFWGAGAAAFMWLIAWGAGEVSRYNGWMRMVPGDLRATGIEYAKGEELAYGPGGDEYWLAIYSMDGATAGQIAREGRAFFYRQDNIDLRMRRRDGYQHQFMEWFPTPVLVPSHGFGAFPPAGTPVPMGVRQYSYGGEGAPVPFPEGPPELADSIFAEPGNFYSENGHSTIVIVSPARRKIVSFHRRGMAALPR
jgi:hypothetical protein